MDTIRRQLIGSIAAALVCAPVRSLFGQSADDGLTPSLGNFRYIYRNSAYRAEFRNFLINVFHLFPEDALHQLIHETAMQAGSDHHAYLGLQPRLDEIKPFLSDLTYSLPALWKQKAVLTDQTVQLLGDQRRFEGYLEIGSNGRYLDALEERLSIGGQRIVVSERAPTRSLVDILDRGQIGYSGDYLSLNDYEPEFSKGIAPGSLDLVTVFIGFHHCPIHLRESFFGSIRDLMAPGAALVVRDHNVHDEKMRRMVALAHDVFNMGTGEAWDYNRAELRNFYSLDELDEMLRAAGFASLGNRLFQDGDPTLNALMLYRKA